MNALQIKRRGWEELFSLFLVQFIVHWTLLRDEQKWNQAARYCSKVSLLKLNPFCQGSEGSWYVYIRLRKRNSPHHPTPHVIMPKQLCLCTGMTAKCVNQNSANALRLACLVSLLPSITPYSLTYPERKFCVFCFAFKVVSTSPKSAKIQFSPLRYIKLVQQLRMKQKAITTHTPPILPAQTSVHNKLDQENYAAEK